MTREARMTRFDTIILGGGFAGLATAARLQAAGASTLVIERHGQAGGCAGFFRQSGFAFDVGATTLVDFAPGGVGGELLDSIGLSIDAELLPGYVAWLPDRQVHLARDVARWRAERLDKLGDAPRHRAFWNLMDTLADALWSASRRGIRLPLRSPADLLRAAALIELRHWPLARYVTWTLGDALRAHGLRHEPALVGLLAMLVEDTVHGTVDAAPLINAALGITIRGAGLSRCRGGMWGFWRALVDRYRALGGVLRVGTCALEVTGARGAFTVHTSRGAFEAATVVSALPADLTAGVVPALREPLRPYLERDAGALGGAVVVFLGVPQGEVQDHAWTHHQVLTDYGAQLGNGNNMFISVSSAGDRLSAPEGCRAVMISTHCELADWERGDYAAKKAEIQRRLIAIARRVYPRLGTAPRVLDVGTPRSYERYTGRTRGAVGGVRQTLFNANQRAIPHQLGPNGLWLVGDSTWPGLGTVACTLGSRLVAKELLGEGVRVTRPRTLIDALRVPSRA